MATKKKEGHEDRKPLEVSERLRKGSSYIGKIVYDENGTKYVQCSRGPSIGTIICTGLEEDGETPKIGYALIHPTEDGKISWKDAQDLARERANGTASTPNPILPSSCKQQYNHFVERVQRYFNPEKFSKKAETRPGYILKVYVDNDPDMNATGDFVTDKISMTGGTTLGKKKGK